LQRWWARVRAKGLPISVQDAQIASIALGNQKTVVARNTDDFEKIQSLNLVNHW
jgi:toxin FitB